MNSWFQLAIVLQLGLLNFAFPVASSCRTDGLNVFQVGDQLTIKCVATDGDRTDFMLDTNSRANKTSKERSSIVTIDSVTMDDSGKYRCKCSTTSEQYADHYVLVVEANMYALMNNVSCEVAVMLMVTAQTDRFNLTSFSCPTLGHGNPSVWRSLRAANRHGDHVLHIFAVGESGGASDTCYVTVGYYPNGANFTGHFSKTVAGNTSCNKRIGPVATKQISSEDPPVASKSGRGASRDAQHGLLVAALILLCHSAKCSFNC